MADTIGQLSVDMSLPGAVERAVGLWRQRGVVVFPSLLSGSAVRELREAGGSALRNSAVDYSNHLRESHTP